RLGNRRQSLRRCRSPGCTARAGARRGDGVQSRRYRDGIRRFGTGAGRIPARAPQPLVVGNKYWLQSAGVTATLERQLTRLGTDVIDFYQLHSLPDDPRFYEELYALKRAGKVRFVGVSLYSAEEIDYVIDRTQLDGVQLCLSLLDPDPFLRRV